MILWILGQIGVFSLVVTAILINKKDRITWGKTVAIAISLGLLMSVAFFYLSYLYMVPLDWIESIPVLDLIIPIVWVVVAVLSWAKGSRQLQRYFSGVMFLLSPLSLYALAVLKWQWDVIRWLVLSMLFLSFVIHVVPKIKKTNGARHLI
ncbi:MAG: hypothetical protein ACOY9Y_12190 [Bacillota bacterium]